jgi:hypothetical protein
MNKNLIKLVKVVTNINGELTECFGDAPLSLYTDGTDCYVELHGTQVWSSMEDNDFETEQSIRKVINLRCVEFGVTIKEMFESLI